MEQVSNDSVAVVMLYYNGRKSYVTLAPDKSVCCCWMCSLTEPLTPSDRSTARLEEGRLGAIFGQLPRIMSAVRFEGGSLKTKVLGRTILGAV